MSIKQRDDLYTAICDYCGKMLELERCLTAAINVKECCSWGKLDENDICPQCIDKWKAREMD